MLRTLVTKYWLRASQRSQYSSRVCADTPLPLWLCTEVPGRSNSSSRAAVEMRPISINQLIVPSMRRPTIGDCSFTAPRAWNELPETLQRLSSPPRFNQLLKLTIFNSLFRETTISYCEVLLKRLVLLMAIYNSLRFCTSAFSSIDITTQLQHVVDPVIYRTFHAHRLSSHKSASQDKPFIVESLARYRTDLGSVSCPGVKVIDLWQTCGSGRLFQSLTAHAAKLRELKDLVLVARTCGSPRAANRKGRPRPAHTAIGGTAQRSDA